jgi:hypothetical protein
MVLVVVVAAVVVAFVVVVVAVNFNQNLPFRQHLLLRLSLRPKLNYNCLHSLSLLLCILVVVFVICH